MNRAIILLSILLATVLASAQNPAPTLADAQRSYVAGNWKEAASAYEKVCPTQPAETQVSCNLWGILAMSQVGDAKSFKKAGIKLDSLIEATNPQHENYADLIMTRAQFMLYLGKYDQAATELIHAIETSQDSHKLVLQKVCSAVLSRATNADLSERCEGLKHSENTTPSGPQVPVTPAKSDSSLKSQAAQPVTTPTPQTPQEVKPVAASEKQPQDAIQEQKDKDVKPEQSSSEEYWALQLGAFGVKSNATLLVTNLKKQKIQSTIIEFTRGERVLYLVQSGHFTTKEAAVSYGEKTFTPLNVEFQPILKK